MKEHAVDVWTVDLERPGPVVLSPDEHARAARFRFEADRRHWIVARSALRRVLATYTGFEPDEIRFTVGPQGKPSTPGIEFNLSHARNQAMIAISQAIPVGIDIEWIRDNVEIEKLLCRIGETEVQGSRPELFHLWTRREARTKAVGSSLMEMPAEDVIAVDIRAPEGFAASVALVNRAPVVRYCGGAE